MSWHSVKIFFKFSFGTWRFQWIKNKCKKKKKQWKRHLGLFCGSLNWCCSIWEGSWKSREIHSETLTEQPGKFQQQELHQTHHILLKICKSFIFCWDSEICTLLESINPSCALLLIPTTLMTLVNKQGGKTIGGSCYSEQFPCPESSYKFYCRFFCHHCICFQGNGQPENSLPGVHTLLSPSPFQTLPHAFSSPI